MLPCKSKDIKLLPVSQSQSRQVLSADPVITRVVSPYYQSRNKYRALSAIDQAGHYF